MIRDDPITTDMASSLVNDHDNLNRLIKQLIEVAELVYSDTDPVMGGIGMGLEGGRNVA